MQLSHNLEENITRLEAAMGVGKSFDVLIRQIRVGGKDAALLFLDGFVKDDIVTRLMHVLMESEHEDIVPNTLKRILRERLMHFEVATAETDSEIIEQVLAGQMAILIDGLAEAIIADVRQYPGRAPEEPDLERVTRGSRDGFVETLIFNTALIRRRLRDPKLRFEMLNVGERSKTDVVVAYIEDLAAKDLVEEVKQRIKKVKVQALPLGVKNLAEHISEQSWNPLPKARFTERPDVVSAHLLEGYVVVLTDTTPSAMIVPTNAWQLTQHAEEYFQLPMVGTYLRWVRYLGILISLMLVPLWLVLVNNKHLLPPALQFLGPKEPGVIPLVVQFLILEVGFDLIRLAFIHTPNALATSLGIVGAILLSDLAVEVGLLTVEPILYIALTAIGAFATPSFELQMAIRLFRYLLFAMVVAFGLSGFWIGLAITLLAFAFTRSFGVPYLWPLIPLNVKALSRMLVRFPMPAVTVRSSARMVARARTKESEKEKEKKEQED